MTEKQTDSYILLHTALKHCSAFGAGEGGMGTLILSYISRLGPFLKVQNFELHFFFGGGGVGAGGQKNKYLWMYDEIRFFYVLGAISINLGLFKVKVQIRKMFLGLLNFKYFFWVCLIFLIFLGVKSRCWVQAYVFKKIESIQNMVRHTYHLRY